jgi:crotonobetainyl-CoA:carnitine CoA-transferase CaiB-like acyl-CoA transferase
LGEHNEELLTEQGYDAAKISELRDKGVIGS